MTSALSAKHFHDEAAAFAYLEAQIWPEGPVCPHCGGTDRISRMTGKSTRLGVHKCDQRRKKFRVTVGTVFKTSHVKLHLWLQAVTLLSSSKMGISSNQLHRVLGVTLKTAWFMSHRIREAMRDGKIARLGCSPMRLYGDVVHYVSEHLAVNHSAGEYVRGEFTLIPSKAISPFSRGACAELINTVC